MAVVTVNYERNRAAIKATIDYIVHRQNRDGEDVTRTLFGYDGPMEKAQAYRMIDEAGTDITFFRIMISPDPEKEDRDKRLDLWTVTQQTMLQLGKHLGRDLQFIATEHSDQTDIRHAHAIVLIPGRLNRGDLRVLRDAATAAALSREQQPQLERRFQARTYRTRKRYLRAPFSRWERPARRARTGFTCPACGVGHRMTRISSGVYLCFECRLVLGKGRGLERGNFQL